MPWTGMGLRPGQMVSEGGETGAGAEIQGMQRQDAGEGAQAAGGRCAGRG